MQIDERHHDEGEGGRRQPRSPVVYAEVLEDKHRPPVIKSWFLQPGTAVKIRSDAGAQPALDGVRRVKPHQHLVGYLRVARLVGSHQAQPVPTHQRNLPINQKKEGKSKKDGRLSDRAPTWQPRTPALGRVLRRWFLNNLHFQRFSGGAFTQSCKSGVGHGVWGGPTGPG